MGLSLGSNFFNFVMAGCQYQMCVLDPLAYTFIFLAISAKFRNTHLWTPILSRDMRFPTMWYVRPAKAQTSLRIRAV